MPSLPTTPLVFLAVSAGGRGNERRAWEVAGVRLELDGTTSETHLYAKVNFPNADPLELEAGGYYDRHPQHGGDGRALEQHTAGVTIEALTRGAVIVSANAADDLDTLARTLRQLGLTPAWHAQPIDLVSASLGWISSTLRMSLVPPVWPGMLAALCGLEPVDSPHELTGWHAMERARFLRRWWERLQPADAEALVEVRLGVAVVNGVEVDDDDPEAADAAASLQTAKELHPAHSSGPSPLDIERARRRQRLASAGLTGRLQ